MAMIARAFIKQDPFEVWGTGQQVRNWTHVSDIVDGTILAAEMISEGIAINLGTRERIRVIDAVREIMDYTGHGASIKFCPDSPTGPYNRVADPALAARLLGWEPKTRFVYGLRRTIDWYFETHDPGEVKARLGAMLVER
jgi:nucleoside-diphosphate-sugar epimerase